MSPESITSVSQSEGTISVYLGYNKDDGFYYKGDITYHLTGQSSEELTRRMDELVTQIHQAGKRLLLEHPQYSEEL